MISSMRLSSMGISNAFIEFLLTGLGSIIQVPNNKIQIILPFAVKYTTTTYGLAIIINWMENKYIMYEKINLFNMNISNIFGGDPASRIEIDFVTNAIIFYYRDNKDIDMENFKVLDNLGKVTGYSVKVAR
jgi:hypothetical protein